MQQLHQARVYARVLHSISRRVHGGHPKCSVSIEAVSKTI